MILYSVIVNSIQRTHIMTAATLSAWSIQRYGNPEQLRPVERQLKTPQSNEVLVHIKASAVTRADGMMRTGTPVWARPFLGFRRPRKDLIGTCLSGEIIATGSNVTRFSVGDHVYGEAGLSFGANASHICLEEDNVLVHKPDFLSFEEAAVMCDGPLTSYNFLHEIAALEPGEKVLILGASGSLGSAAVQIAAAMGAKVSGTCSAKNAGLVASLGADRVIDYNEEDFTNGIERYDVIYDTLGISSFSKARKALTRRGRYVCPVLSFGLLGSSIKTSIFGKQKARFSATGLLKPGVLRQMLDRLNDMAAERTLAPVMDRTYPFNELVDAHHYMETGHKKGNVVVV